MVTYTKKYEKYFRFYPDTPRSRETEKNDRIRLKKAKEQSKLTPKAPKEVEKLVKKFLVNIGVKIGNSITNKGNFIWLKFTTDNFVGVVAAGYDFNFSETNRSGGYIKSVNKTWNTELLMVFPISELPKDKSLREVERAVGNYLIDQKVPIIDFYSHNY